MADPSKPQRGKAGLAPPRPGADGSPPVQLTIEVVAGDITQEETAVAVIGRFEGLPLAGADRQFDQKLNGWLSKAVELRALGSQLGQLFFAPIPKGTLPAGLLLIAGMGEPGRFGRDELRLVMTNVTYGVVALEHREFSSLLIGSGAGGLVG